MIYCSRVEPRSPHISSCVPSFAHIFRKELDHGEPGRVNQSRLPHPRANPSLSSEDRPRHFAAVSAEAGIAPGHHRAVWSLGCEGCGGAADLLDVPPRSVGSSRASGATALDAATNSARDGASERIGAAGGQKRSQNMPKHRC